MSGVGSGQTMVRVTEEEGLTASALVTVVADVNAISEIVLSSPDQTLEIGETTQFSYTVSNIQGAELSGPFEPIWSSSNDNIVEVNDQGEATAIAAGSVEITANIDGIVSLPYTLSVAVGERTGTFQGTNGYNVSGSVTVSESEVAFGSDFNTSSGPGLYIYLSNSSGNVSGGIELGEIKGNAGSQTYPIPPGEDANNYQFVIVYCKPFGISFGFAKLQ